MVWFGFNCGKNPWDLPSKVFKHRIQYRWLTLLCFNNQTSILFCCFHTFSSHICSNSKWVPTKHQPDEAPEPTTGQQQDERHSRREEGTPRGFRRRVREDVEGRKRSAAPQHLRLALLPMSDAAHRPHPDPVSSQPRALGGQHLLLPIYAADLQIFIPNWTFLPSTRFDGLGVSWVLRRAETKTEWGDLLRVMVVKDKRGCII